MAKSITIILEEKKVTDNKVLFEEPVTGKLAIQKIGKVYIPKIALAEIKYKGEGKVGMMITVDGTDGIKCKMGEPTKNTVPYAEIIPDNYTPAHIGSVYIPKTTLPELGITSEEQTISVKICKV